MTTLEQKYKYALLDTINGTTFITFYNDKKYVKPEPHKRLMYDVTYYIADNILFISGKEDIPVYIHETTYLSELEYQPQKEYIKYNKGIKLFGITFFETHDEYNLFDSFVMLRRCRNAYWKIAGEEMGLDKPWTPDWTNYDEYKHCLYITENVINKGTFYNDSQILSFPTAEMRNAFYENFKNEIEQCKELL